MKNLIALCAFALLTHSGNLHAQPPASEETQAQIVLPDHSTLSGTVKENIRKKGEVLFTSGEKKTKFRAGDIAELQIGSTRYITHNYTFYEVIASNKSVTLLRKASEPSGLQYQGTDAIAVSSEGKIDDLFLRQGTGSFQLLTKKNWKQVLNATCTSCGETASFDAAALKLVLENCTGCQ